MNTTLTSRRIRSNAGPLILTGSRKSKGRDLEDMPLTHNIIIDIHRDLYDPHEIVYWAYDLLECVSYLRLEYDSPRIGGGLEPDIRLMGSKPDVGTGSLYTYEGVHDYVTDYKIDADTMQDWICHAEAVARLTIAVFQN